MIGKIAIFKMNDNFFELHQILVDLKESLSGSDYPLRISASVQDIAPKFIVAEKLKTVTNCNIFFNVC